MLCDLLTLSHVPRWAIIDTMKKQTVADHSFRVAAVCLQFIKELRAIGIEIDKGALLETAITHDIEEAKSGDLPTPFKKRLANFGFVQAIDCDDTLEHNLAKLADLIEALTFLRRYGVRPGRVEKELHSATYVYRDIIYDTHIALKVPRGWWNRIVDTIIETGVNYE